nr:GNAT family N-acetyltransferase [Acidovorax sp. sic0104]
MHSPWTCAPTDHSDFSDFMEPLEHERNHSFLVCRRSPPACDEEIAGVINIAQVVIGAFCSGCLGYYVFADYERQGLMRAGLAQAREHAFNTLGLHRLEANIPPGNVASIALFRSCGVSWEGFSPRYLRIQGEWRDHERWACLAD